MSKRTLFAVSLFMILLIPVALLAQRGAMEKRHKEMGCMQEKKGLDLDPGQQLTIEKLKLEFRLANIDIRAEQMKMRMQIKEELLKEETSRKAIDKYSKAIASNREKMQKNRIDHALEIKKVLKPEQWKMFVVHHWDGMGMGHGGMGHGARGYGRDGSCHPMGRGMRDGCGMHPRRDVRGSGRGCLYEDDGSE